MIDPANYRLARAKQVSRARQIGHRQLPATMLPAIAKALELSESHRFRHWIYYRLADHQGPYRGYTLRT